MNSGFPSNNDAADVISNTMTDGINNNDAAQSTGQRANSNISNERYHSTLNNNNTNLELAPIVLGPSLHVHAGTSLRTYETSAPSRVSETGGPSTENIRESHPSIDVMSVENNNVSLLPDCVNDLAQLSNRTEDDGRNNNYENDVVGPAGQGTEGNREEQLETSPLIPKTLDNLEEEKFVMDEPNENNQLPFPVGTVNTDCQALTPEKFNAKKRSQPTGSSESYSTSPESATRNVLSPRNGQAPSDDASCRDCVSLGRPMPQYSSTPPTIREKSNKSMSGIAPPRARKKLFSSPSPSLSAPSRVPSHQRSGVPKHGCSDPKKSRASVSLPDNVSETSPHGKNSNLLVDSPKSRKNAKHRCKDAVAARPELMPNRSPKSQTPCSSVETSHRKSKSRFGDSSCARKNAKRGCSKQIGELCAKPKVEPSKSPKNRAAGKPGPGDPSPDPQNGSGSHTPTGGDFPRRVFPQTGEGSPGSDSLPLFLTLPVTSSVNYLPFWQNLHVGDLDLDFVLRHFHSAADLLRVAGPHVDSVAIRSTMWQTEARVEKFAQQIPLFCSNIKEITVDFDKISENALARIAQMNRGLEKVWIKRMFVKNGKSLIRSLTSLTCLQELKITLLDEIEIDLEKQNMVLLTTAIRELLAKNQHLHTVKFTFVVNSEIVKTLLEHCPTLEHLELNVTKARKYLRPSAFAVYHPVLKTLVLRSKVRFFTDSWLETILNSFPALQKLELWGLQSDVSRHLVDMCFRKFDAKLL